MSGIDMIRNIKKSIINKMADKIPEDKKKMLSRPGLIYQKYVTRMDKFLSFIFRIEFYHLVWEYPNSKRYYD